MLSIQKLELAKGGSVKQVQSYLEKNTEYYEQENNKILPPAKWFGSLADELGLNDAKRDAKKDFANLLAGFDPNKKKKLVQNAGSKDRTLGFDLTFSAEKSYSIAIASAEPELRDEMLKAHERANNAALSWVQSELTSRIGKGGKKSIEVSGIAVRQVTHIDSRNGDPQVHTHNVLANVVKCADGKVRTLDATPLVATKLEQSLKHTAGAIYRHHLAQEFQKLGFGIERDVVPDKHKKPMLVSSIVGIDKATCDAFSTRRKEIIEASNDETDLNATAKKSRQKKTVENEPTVVCANTLQRLEQMRQEKTLHWKDVSELRHGVSRDIELDTDALFAELHATNSTFSRYQLLEGASRQIAMNKNIETALQALFDVVMKDDVVLQLGKDKYCARAQYELEMRIVYDASKRVNDSVRLNDDVVVQSIAKHEAEQGFALSNEQRDAVRFVTQQTGGLACISGFAGTGKTATAGAYIRAFEASGFNVLGCSTSQLASEKLADEARIKAFNTTDLLNKLDNGKITFDSKTVLILDEAGMVGAKSFHRLQQHIDAVGGKLIAVGDALQLTPIEAGSPFRKVIDEVGDVKQTEIRRQKNEQLRATANAFYNGKSGSEIVASLQQAGRVRVGKSDELMQELAHNYVNAKEPAHEKLIVAQTNDDVNKIANYVREQMRNKGLLIGEDFNMTVEKSEGRFTFKEEKNFAVGDRIKLTKNNKRNGFVNGSVGVISEIKQTENGLEISMKDDSGNVKKIPASYKNITHAYASTVHSAQGQGMDRVFFYAGNTATSRNAFLVATTRAKQEFTVYATPQRLAKLEKSIDVFTLKQTAVEIEEKYNDKNALRRSAETNMRWFIEDCKKFAQERFKPLRDEITRKEELILKANKSEDAMKNAKDIYEAKCREIEREKANRKMHADILDNLGVFDVFKKSEQKQVIAEIDARIDECRKQRAIFERVYNDRKSVFANWKEELPKLKQELHSDEMRQISQEADGWMQFAREQSKNYPGGEKAYWRDQMELSKPKSLYYAKLDERKQRIEHQVRMKQQQEQQQEQQRLQAMKPQQRKERGRGGPEL